MTNRSHLLPDKPWGKELDGSWLESACSGSRLVTAPPGGSSEGWGWAGTSPEATGRHRENTALCYTYTENK